jgi:hypothetical protein
MAFFRRAQVSAHDHASFSRKIQNMNSPYEAKRSTNGGELLALSVPETCPLIHTGLAKYLI